MKQLYVDKVRITAKHQKERIQRRSDTTINSLDEQTNTAKINDYAVSLKKCILRCGGATIPF